MYVKYPKKNLPSGIFNIIINKEARFKINKKTNLLFLHSLFKLALKFLDRIKLNNIVKNIKTKNRSNFLVIFL